MSEKPTPFESDYPSAGKFLMRLYSHGFRYPFGRNIRWHIMWSGQVVELRKPITTPTQ